MSTSYSSAVRGIRLPGSVFASGAKAYVAQHGTMSDRMAYGRHVAMAEQYARRNPYQDYWMWTSPTYSPGTAYYYPYFMRHPTTSANLNLRATGYSTYAEWLARGN